MNPPGPHRSTAAAAAIAVGLTASRAPAAPGEPPSEEVAERIAPLTPLTDRGPYLHLLGTVAVGRGLRFNNPFRLSRQLGGSAESVSLTATYLDLSVAALTGDPLGLQHGGWLHASFALSGVPQQVVTPGYAILYRFGPRWSVWGRPGVPLVTGPDANAGLELAAGAAFFVFGGLGVTGEVLYDLFWGAATDQVTRTRIPILSAQLGFVVELEVLP